MQYKEEDILINDVDQKRKILGICGKVYFLSNINYFTKVDNYWTIDQITNMGYKLQENLPEIKVTIEEIAKLKGVVPSQINIIE
jgi:tetrahydromethanopterin S-methyltransferase subunit A